MKKSKVNFQKLEEEILERMKDYIYEIVDSNDWNDLQDLEEFLPLLEELRIIRIRRFK